MRSSPPKVATGYPFCEFMGAVSAVWLSAFAKLIVGNQVIHDAVTNIGQWRSWFSASH